MPFYRIGEPGADTWAHINFGRQAGSVPCRAAKDPKDDPKLGDRCNRVSVALCDAPAGQDLSGKALTCDMPICDRHRARHKHKGNTDYCPRHAGLAEG